MFRRALVLGGLLALLPTVSQAALLLFVDQVQGPSKLTNYAGWFHADDVSWSIERASAAKPHSLTVSLKQSAALAVVAQAGASGAVFKKIVVDQLEMSGEVQSVLQLIARLTCDEAGIGSYASSADADDQATVELNIRCGKLTWEFYDYTSKGVAEKAGKGSWNFKTNTP